MNKERTIRVVGTKDGEIFFVQALEVDVAAQGRTKEEAIRRLQVALNAEEREAKAEGKDLFDIGPAPKAFHDLYDDHPDFREKLVA